MKLYEYVHGTTDWNLLKSLPEETLKAAGVEMDALEKAMGHEGLTQKDVTVTKEGKTFTRKQWVKTDSGSSSGGHSASDGHDAHRKLREMFNDGKIKSGEMGKADKLKEQMAEHEDRNEHDKAAKVAGKLKKLHSDLSGGGGSDSKPEPKPEPKKEAPKAPEKKEAPKEPEKKEAPKAEQKKDDNSSGGNMAGMEKEADKMFDDIQKWEKAPRVDSSTLRSHRDHFEDVHADFLHAKATKNEAAAAKHLKDLKEIHASANKVYRGQHIGR